MRQLFFYKMRHTFVTKCVSFFVTECDIFIRECNSIYKMRQFFYKMRRLLENTSAQTGRRFNLPVRNQHKGNIDAIRLVAVWSVIYSYLIVIRGPPRLNWIKCDRIWSKRKDFNHSKRICICFLRILTWKSTPAGKNHPQIKLWRLRKVWIWTFGSLVHQINFY